MYKRQTYCSCSVCLNLILNNMIIQYLIHESSVYACKAGRMMVSCVLAWRLHWGLLLLGTVLLYSHPVSTGNQSSGALTGRCQISQIQSPHCPPSLWTHYETWPPIRTGLQGIHNGQIQQHQNRYLWSACRRYTILQHHNFTS